ncbi:hypothetical protein D3C71_2151760 [compost metagenome]
MKPYLVDAPSWLHYVSAASGAILVVATGKFLASRKFAAAAPLHEIPLAANKDHS